MKTFNIRYRNIEKFKSFLDAKSIDQSQNILLLLFASHTKKSEIQKVLKEIKLVLKGATIIGSSSDGEIIDSKITTNNIVLSMMIFDDAKIDAKLLHYNIGDDFYELGKSLNNSLIKDDTKALFLFATLKNLNGTTLLNGLKSSNDIFTIAGSVGGDDDSLEKTFVFLDDKVSFSGVVAVSLSSKKLQANTYVLHGWEPVSKKFLVTGANKNILKTLDNKKAQKIYSEYVGVGSDRIIQKSLEFPFINYSRSGKMVTKNIWQVTDDGELILSSDIKQGDTLEISFANLSKIEQEISEIFEDLKSKPVESVLFFASSARRRYLDQLAKYEISTISQVAPSFGMYGLGQFSSNAKKSNFLNQSLIIVTLSEGSTLPKLQKGVSFKKPVVSNFDTIETLRNIAQVSSNELELLNKKLEYKVNESVRAVRKKDSIMIHNSRLAQLGEMLGLIAHQWRQPLSAISATATGMELKLELGTIKEDQQIRYLKDIQKYVSHLSETIDDFTNFFKPTKKRDSVLVEDMVEKSLFIASPLLTKESVDVVKKYNSTNKISTYPNEIVQVLLNLIRNSVNAFVKFSTNEREIYIVEYQKDSQNIIEFEDNAGGIDEKIISKIFEPYFSTKNSSNSMGVGLYMSKFIIEESCGGTIRVTNGKYGAKFTMTIPS